MVKLLRNSDTSDHDMFYFEGINETGELEKHGARYPLRWGFLDRPSFDPSVRPTCLIAGVVRCSLCAKLEFPNTMNTFPLVEDLERLRLPKPLCCLGLDRPSFGPSVRPTCPINFKLIRSPARLDPIFRPT